MVSGDAAPASFAEVLLQDLEQSLGLHDLVVAAGSFLVDAETRLNPAAGSIYFGGSGGSKGSPPSTSVIRPTTPVDPDAQVQVALAKLSAEDRKLAEAQQFCPVLEDSRLGSMGTPVKLTLEGQTVLVCCTACTKQALADPQETLARVKRRKQAGRPVAGGSRPSAEVAERDHQSAEDMAKLAPHDRILAERQRFCAVRTQSRLGTMGSPMKLMIEGQPVFLCCEGCKEKALSEPAETLARARLLIQKN